MIRKPAKALYAVVNELGEICYTRGGSSTSPKLLVYENESSAKRALSSNFTKQAIDTSKVSIRRIYSSQRNTYTHI